MEDVSGEALGVDADDRGLGVDVSHDEGDCGFYADGGGGDGVVAGLGSCDGGFEAENAELSPAGGEVGIGELAYAGEGHGWIIRLRLHKNWMAGGWGLMQLVTLLGIAGGFG